MVENDKCAEVTMSYFKKGLLLFVAFFLFIFNFSCALGATTEKKLAVLLYHHVVPKDADTSSIISLSDFESQMEYLYKHGYYTASLKELEEFLYDEKELPEKTVIITFDDGYESNYIYAYPVLKKYGFKGIIFIIGDKVVESKQSSNPNMIPKLTYDEIREMADSGLVEFGSHTFDAHEMIDGKPALLNMSSEEIYQDFEKIKELFNKLGLPNPRGIAYPFGGFDDKTVKAAEAIGLKLGFTVKKGFLNQDSPAMTLNRIIIPANTTSDEFKLLLEDDSSPLPEGFEDCILLRPGSCTAYVMGKPTLLETSPIIYNGVTMAPLSFFVEKMGWDVYWNPLLGRVINMDDKAGVSLPTYFVRGKVMVPVRSLAEALGYKVMWHHKEKTVEIKKP